VPISDGMMSSAGVEDAFNHMLDDMVKELTLKRVETNIPKGTLQNIENKRTYSFDFTQSVSSFTKWY
jgi:hypothetical protein